MSKSLEAEMRERGLYDTDEITETLKGVEAAGIDEVILYFNVGNKPHDQVKEQMHRFMEQVAPNFEGQALRSRRSAD